LEGTAKLRDLGFDPHVNLSYRQDRTREWISVSTPVTLAPRRAAMRASRPESQATSSSVARR